MPITRFTRPFTDEEREKLEQRRLRLEQELADPPKRQPERQRVTHPRVVFLRLTALILFVVILLAQDPKTLHFWCVVAALGIGFLWWGYPQRKRDWQARQDERDERSLASWRQGREYALAQTREALATKTVHEAHCLADALIAFDDDEYFLGFYRLEERLWLCLEDRMDWPVNSEFSIVWHAAKWPHIASLGGKELEIVAPQWDEEALDNSDISWDDGDLFSLTLEELLAAMPETFRKAYRGNLFAQADESLSSEFP